MFPTSRSLVHHSQIGRTREADWRDLKAVVLPLIYPNVNCLMS